MRRHRHLASTTTLTAATALAALGMLAEALSAPAALARGGADELTVTVTDSGGNTTDGTYTVRCRPTGGDHPEPERACAALDEAGRGGRDPFAPVPRSEPCTMIYGGPATAHVTGVWKGRSVDARFKRSNGCEIERWDALVPALPKVS
ncbi:SSI family serine proteinase inhibitor [Streptomyces sp. NPDC048172]|uniref:SSI family serine proteinase inhibitor n=1 Tax=Streptomyces sp. NPDC048172 TaxID=3365505 RepID=UPI003722DAEF